MTLTAFTHKKCRCACVYVHELCTNMISTNWEKPGRPALIVILANDSIYGVCMCVYMHCTKGQFNIVVI